MAVLKIVEYPNPVLSKKAKPIETISQKELRLIQDMIDTLYQEDGVGLAAPQVGVSKRIIVVSPNAERGEERVYINPKIIKTSPEEETGLEGCLSLPGVSCEVRRAKKIEFRALDLKGIDKTESAQGFLARVIQHEIDHLNGILLINRVDFNQRQSLLGTYRRL
ncbi:MAG: peptide deformylase [Candidatus Omnitrophica bacterium]|nr:peptide deformylase [Candidatus Omnitrophota bacterium]